MSPTPIGWRNPGPKVSPLVHLGRLLGCGASPDQAFISPMYLQLGAGGYIAAELSGTKILVFRDYMRRLDSIGIPGIEAITSPEEAVAFAIKALEARGGGDE